MSTNKEETLRQFCDVTGADESRSKFFLESSNWQLDVALSSFYEHGGNADEAPTANPAAAVSSLPTLSDSDMDSPPGSPLQPQKKDKKKTPSSNFATLDSLQQETSSEDEEVSVVKEADQYELSYLYLFSDWIKNKYEAVVQNIHCDDRSCSDNKSTDPELTENKCGKVQQVKTCSRSISIREHGEEESCDSSDSKKEEIERLKGEIERLLCENSELRKYIEKLKGVTDGASHSKSDTGQAFYAGGSERSGQQILGPGKGRKDIVTEVFKSVRERGAVVFEDEPSSTSRGRSVFGGVGYRLGQTSDDHEPIAEGEQQGQADAPRSVRLRLYREGFTVDSGPLRSYTDPDHAEFLNCIRRGVIPPELSAAGGGEVRVSLEDRRHEECPRNVAKPQPFTGKGHLLGSPTPVTVGAPMSVAAAPADRAANMRAAQDAVGVDSAHPTTTIQFRLADGSRLTGRFNHTHTVADLVEYVSRAEPTYQLQPFTLLSTFPSTELTDTTMTLAQANILNSTLLQRLK